jgi:hypothetical protein
MCFYSLLLSEKVALQVGQLRLPEILGFDVRFPFFAILKNE